MSPALVHEPQNVEADINYWPPDGEELVEGKLKDRFLGVGDEFTRKMLIEDIRGREDEFNWEQQGFQIVRLPKKERHEFDSAWAKEHLYPEVGEAVKKITGADDVLVVMHVSRAAPDTTFETKPDLHNASGNGPSAQAHVDYCGDHGLMQVVKNSALSRLPDGHPFKSKLQTARRWAMFNTWKPVKTVQRDPLTVADCRSVPDEDFRVKKREYAPGVFGGSYSLAHGSQENTHKWYYLHHQTPEELLVFRGYDSDQSTPGYRTPHTAFRVPGMDHLPARESIECRAFVIWE